MKEKDVKNFQEEALSDEDLENVVGGINRTVAGNVSAGNGVGYGGRATGGSTVSGKKSTPNKSLADLIYEEKNNQNKNKKVHL